MFRLRLSSAWKIRRHQAAWLLVCCFSLSFAAGCKGGKAADATQPASAASPQAVPSPKVEQDFLCKMGANFQDDHFLVDFDAKTVRSESVVAGGPNGPTRWNITNVSITEDAIGFTQKIDFGGTVLQRTVSINRKSGAFTTNGVTKGRCTVVGTISDNSTGALVIEEYQATNLPFQAQFVLKKGGGFQDEVTAGGKIKTSCFDVALDKNGLSLGNHSIPLQSKDLTTDCMIGTKDYGDLQVKFNSATQSTSVLVKPTQEALLRKLAQQ